MLGTDPPSLHTPTSRCSLQPEEQKRQHAGSGTTYFSFQEDRRTLISAIFSQWWVNRVHSHNTKVMLISAETGCMRSCETQYKYLSIHTSAHTHTVSYSLIFITFRALISPSVKESFELKGSCGCPALLHIREENIQVSLNFKHLSFRTEMLYFLLL